MQCLLVYRFYLTRHFRASLRDLPNTEIKAWNIYVYQTLVYSLSTWCTVYVHGVQFKYMVYSLCTWCTVYVHGVQFMYKVYIHGVQFMYTADTGMYCNPC